MRRIIISVLALTSAPFLVAYLVGSYVAMDFNPAHWTELSRILHMYFSLSIGVVFGILIGLE